MAANAAPAPQADIISNISDKLVLTLQNSPAQVELSHVYIPPSIRPQAVEKLRKTALKQNYSFVYSSQRLNRHGNFSAIVNHGATSLQEELLAEGLAWVYFIDFASNTTALFTAEAKARKAALGIWGNGKTIIINSDAITNGYRQYLNQFMIIEGVVDNLYISKKNTFLNFGQDWQTDFSVQLDNNNLKNFPEFHAEQLKGRKLRVRGWLESYNGPFMKIFNPSNIELITEK